jgi:broad specificity phosphatase PhoE
MRAVEQVMAQSSDDGDVAIIGHGGTATLLYAIDRVSRKLVHAWLSIDADTGELLIK